MIETLFKLFRRDLEKLRTELLLYNNEDNIWRIDKQISNSAGNLCLHLIGNLNAYIGAGIGNTSYIRNRESEFALKGVKRAELLLQIDETIRVIESSLKLLKEEDLDAAYPNLVWEAPTTTGYLLAHLTTHLAYHLGQVNYHRRLLDN